MKKVICFVVCCIAVLTVTSCGNSPNNADIIAEEITATGSDGLVYNSYQTACSKGDFDAARDYIGKMKNKLPLIDGDYDRDAYAELIQKAEEYVENEEVQYLSSLNEELANNRVIMILSQKSIEGIEAPEKACLGKNLHKYDLAEELESSFNNCPTELKDFKRYIAWCHKYNIKCNSILNFAITSKNEDLAKKILPLFRPDPYTRLEESKDEDLYDVYAHYTNATKEGAQKKYDEAVKSGAFN